jgi:hypothetical protein
MKILIAIPSCHALRHWHEVVRSTWGKDIRGADLRFFLGSLPQAEDEVELNVGDSLYALTHKTVEMYRWSQVQGYDFVFKCDLDTFVRPLRLLESDFYRFDWVGGQNSFFASGGAGYWLSRRAMEAVVEWPVEPGPAEDVNTAHALLAKGIALRHEPRFLFIPGQIIDASTITCHLSSVKAWDAKATIEELREAYLGGKTPILQTGGKAPTAVRPFRRLR